jgi:hypothetical protein
MGAIPAASADAATERCDPPLALLANLRSLSRPLHAVGVHGVAERISPRPLLRWPTGMWLRTSRLSDSKFDAPPTLVLPRYSHDVAVSPAALREPVRVLDRSLV